MVISIDFDLDELAESQGLSMRDFNRVGCNNIIDKFTRDMEAHASSSLNETIKKEQEKTNG